MFFLFFRILNGHGKGYISIGIVELKTYIESCKKSLMKKNLKIPEIFWKIASIKGDFENSVRRELYGDGE